MATGPTRAEADTPITLTLQSSGYEKWGRPAGMDNPGAGCGPFNDSRPVTKFTASVNVANNGGKPLENWYLFVFKNSGAEAYVCYYISGHGFPKVEPGQSANITFAAFMEPGETAARLVVVDEEAGQSNAVSFGEPPTKPTATPQPTRVPRGARPSKAATTTPAPTPVAPIGVVIQSSGTEAWGRPVGMDDPGAGCSAFDDRRQVSKYNVSVRVTNNSTKDMIRWYAKVVKGDGREAFVCYYAYPTGFPAIASSQTRDVTFAAFVEPGEQVKSITIIDEDIGKSAELTLP